MAKKKQTTNSINIDGVDYKEDDLSDLSKLHVKRINELRSELTSLQMMIMSKVSFNLGFEVKVHSS